MDKIKVNNRIKEWERYISHIDRNASIMSVLFEVRRNKYLLSKRKALNDLLS